MDEIEEYEQAHLTPPPVAPPADGGDGDTPSVTPQPPVVQKKKKNLSISSVAGARTYTISSEADVDSFLAEMRKKLISELDEDTVITLS